MDECSRATVNGIHHAHRAYKLLIHTVLCVAREFYDVGIEARATDQDSARRTVYGDRYVSAVCVSAGVCMCVDQQHHH